MTDLPGDEASGRGLEKTYADKVEFRRLNVETDQAAIDLANKMGVQYVPTFVFVNSNGVVAKNVVGADDRTEHVRGGAVAAVAFVAKQRAFIADFQPNGSLWEPFVDIHLM